MAEEDATGGNTDRLRGQHVLVLLDGYDGAFRYPGTANAGGYPQDHYDLRQTPTHQGHHRHQDQQHRDGQPGIDDPHHDEVELATEESCGDAQYHRDGEVDEACPQADNHGDTSPVDDTAENVPSQLVSAKPMLCRWWGQPVHDFDLRIVIGRQLLSEDTDEEQQHHDHRASGPKWLLPEKSGEKIDKGGASLRCFSHGLSFPFLSGTESWDPGRRKSGRPAD